MNLNDYSCSAYLCGMLLKTLYLLPHLFYNVELELIQSVSQHQINSKDKNAVWVSKCDEYWSYWVLSNASWIFLRFIKYLFERDRFVGQRFWYVRYSIPCKYFIGFQEVLKTAWRHLGDQQMFAGVNDLYDCRCKLDIAI